MVVLLERDVEAWAHSWFCHKFRSGLWHHAVSYPDVFYRIDTMIYSSAENGLLDRKRYKEINRNVKLVIPSHRLLVLDIMEDPAPWSELAPFLVQHLQLDLRVNPHQPFQRTNPSQAFCPRRGPPAH